MKLHCLDGTHACFNGLPQRSLCLNVPSEMGMGKHVVGRRRRCIYGTRDAGAIWEETFTRVLVDIGVQQGRESPRTFYHPKWEVSLVVRGDDFTALGTRQELDLYEEAMASAFEIKNKGRLGNEDGDVQEIENDESHPP